MGGIGARRSVLLLLCLFSLFFPPRWLTLARSQSRSNSPATLLASTRSAASPVGSRGSFGKSSAPVYRNRHRLEATTLTRLRSSASAAATDAKSPVTLLPLATNRFLALPVSGSILDEVRRNSITSGIELTFSSFPFPSRSRLPKLHLRSNPGSSLLWSIHIESHVEVASRSQVRFAPLSLPPSPVFAGPPRTLISPALAPPPQMHRRMSTCPPKRTACSCPRDLQDPNRQDLRRVAC